MYQQRRRKKRHTHGLRTVEVMRGRTGYGFTISGQHPSILSCIVGGSPADRAGLKTGDILISLNNLNVSKSSHDDIVRMVGSSSGLLVLQIAENYNSSDSSDDEFQNRPKTKYPNRTRRREGHKEKSFDDLHVQSRSGGNKYSNKKEVYDQLRARALSPGRQLEQKYLKQSRSQGNENVNPRVGYVGAVPKKAKHVSSSDGIIRYRSPNTKHTIITREARLGIQKPHSAPKRGFVAPTEPPPKVPLAAVDNRLSGGHYYPYLHPQIAHRHQTPQIPSAHPAEDFEDNMYIEEEMRIVVGYAGSIEMPHDPKLANSRLQSIRGAVRRLRVEQKIHTLVLMEVTGEGVKLVNTMNCTIAQYPSTSVAFCGVCSDDPRFFGVITLHTSSRDGAPGDQAALVVGLDGSSCHVFMVDPELSSHAAHVTKARNFGFHCSVSADTQRCLEFPRSATPIVQCIARLYRERQGMLGEAELAQIGAFAGPNFAQEQQRRRENSNSSNSDSGLGIPVREEQAGADRVCVVEMPSQEVDDYQRGDSSMDNSVYVTPSSSLASSMYSSHDISSILLSTGERVVHSSGDRLSTTIDTTSSSLNQSAGPVTNEKLNIRAMPNPRGYNMSGSFGDLLEQQNSADNLRKSMHKMLQNRQKGPDNPSESDAESVRSESSQGNAQFVVPVVPVSQAMHKPTLLPRNSQASAPHSDQVDARRQLPQPVELPPRPQSPKSGSTDPDNRFSGVGSETPSQLYKGRERMPTPSTAKATPKAQILDTPVIKQVTAQTPGGTRLSGYGAMPETFSAFARPNPPGSATKPPLPDRKPITMRPGPKTPAPTPHVERPKSTPPFRSLNPMVDGQKEEYDSDPGELSSYAESLMDVDDLPEQISVLRTPSAKHSLFSKRRQSDGFHFFKQNEPKSNHKSSTSRLFSLGRKSKTPAISTSHESLVVSDAEFPKNKLNGATSIATITAPNLPGQNGLVSTTVGRASGWAVNFNKLLEDKDGLATFTEFLKKEYSEENIVFWALCKKYKKLKTDSMRVKKAREIYNAHLCPKASDPVNVDSESRKAAEAGLMNPTPDLFDAPQLHIFKLMKQDSYVRFLKSDLYKECVVREMEGRPLPHIGADEEQDWDEDDNGNIEKGNEGILKKSKSTSNTGDIVDAKRRKSLLPWSRTKNEKKLVKQASESDVKRDTAMDPPSSPTNLPDLNLLHKEAQANRMSLGNSKPPNGLAKTDIGTQDGVLKENQKFCRVILPDQSTTVIYAQAGQTVKSALNKLCDRRGINMALMEIIPVGHSTALDIESDITVIGSKEIALMKMVVFRLDLPNRKSVAIKAKPSDIIRDVFKPILARYDLKLDENLVVHVAGTGIILRDDAECKTLENKQVVIQSLDDFKGKKKREWGSFGGSQRNLGSKPPIPRGRVDPSPIRQKQTTGLDDVLKSLFKDVISGVTLSAFDEIGMYDPEKKKGDDNRNSGLFGFIRRNSFGEKEGKKAKNKAQGVFSSQRMPPEPKKPSDAKKPPLPKQNAGLDRDGEKFLDLLSKTSRQIDDQRGGTLKDLELPDFLKVKSNSEVTPRPRMRKNIISDSNLMKKLANGPTISKTLPVSRSHERLNVPVKADLNRTAISVQSTGTPMSQVSFQYQDVSFSHDGVVPTNDDAENYFVNVHSRSAMNFNDSRLMDNSLQDLGMGNGNVSFGTFQGQPFQTETPSKGDTSEPRPVPKPRQSRPAVPRRRNPPTQSSDVTPRADVAAVQSSSSDLDITLLPPSSDSSEAELSSPSRKVSPPTPSQRKSKLNRPSDKSSKHVQSSKQYSQAAHSTNYGERLSSLPHSSTAQPIVAESDIEYELTETLANHRINEPGSVTESSTPSPTTHDLVLDSESGMESDSNPTPKVRTSIMKKQDDSSPDSGQKARKSLIFDTSEASGDMKVSFV